MFTDVPDGWQASGTHLIRFEPPNLFLTRSRGDIRAPDVEQMFSIMQAKIDLIGPIYWVANMSEMGRLTMEARRVKGPPGRIHDPTHLLGVGIVGSSFHQRILAHLAIKANRLLRGDKSRINVEFFANEDDARQWVDTCRTKRESR